MIGRLESAAETRCNEACFNCVEEVVRSGFDFAQLIRWIKLAWVEVHRERLRYAEQDAQRKID